MWFQIEVGDEIETEKFLIQVENLVGPKIALPPPNEEAAASKTTDDDINKHKAPQTNAQPLRVGLKRKRAVSFSFYGKPVPDENRKSSRNYVHYGVNLYTNLRSE